MPGFRALSPNINVNTQSGQLRTELQNTFARLDGQLQLAPYRIATQVGPVGNTGASETDLLTTTLDVGTLAKQNSSILLFICGNTAANANNKTIKLYFDNDGSSAVLLNTGAFAGNGISWTIQAEIVRNGASAQAYWAQFLGSATLTSKISVGTAAISLAIPQIIRVTGTGTANSDVSALYFKALLLT